MVAGMNPRDLARLLDHTLLRPDATAAQIRALCDEAVRHGFHSVCVHGGYVATASLHLHAKEPLVACVVGFPLGAGATAARVAEARQACEDGAAELDVVARIGALIDGEEGLFLDDLAALSEAAAGTPVKAILETALLTDAQKRRGAALAKEAGCAFVKTSTGFGPGGATVADVRLLREVVGPDVGVKASGGIRDLETALAMLEAGANRLGTSSSVALVQAAGSPEAPSAG